MDLEHMAIQPRVRNAWEGIDLGFALARTWFWPLWLLWWATTLPVALVAILLFPGVPWAAFLLAWWCKPLLEAPLLVWLSRRLFGESAQLVAVYRAIPAAGIRDLAALLTYRRLASARSFSMPVSMLEGLRGEGRRERLRVLELGRFWPGWLTIICLHFETIVYLSVIGFAASLLPFETDWLNLEQVLFDPSPGVEWVNAAISLLAMSLIAPFFVAAGFALYLTRRSELEAWDIEIRLRQMVGGSTARSVPRTSGVAALVVAIALAPAACPPLLAAPSSPPEARAVIERILDDDAFGEPRTRYGWEFTGGRADSDDADEHPWLTRLGQLLADLGPLLAEIARLVVWLAAAIVVLYLLTRLVDRRDWLRYLRRPGAREQPTRPALFMGVALEPERLPLDVAGSARELVAQGKHREAVRLLFRATLARLLDAQLEIPPSSTELECSRLVARTRPAPEARYFADLVGAWQLIAYAHRTPAPAHLQALIEGWREHYGSPGSLAGAAG